MFNLQQTAGADPAEELRRRRQAQIQATAGMSRDEIRRLTATPTMPVPANVAAQVAALQAQQQQAMEANQRRVLAGTQQLEKFAQEEKRRRQKELASGRPQLAALARQQLAALGSQQWAAWGPQQWAALGRQHQPSEELVAQRDAAIQRDAERARRQAMYGVLSRMNITPGRRTTLMARQFGIRR